MILALGARGLGFNSQSSPVRVHTFLDATLSCWVVSCRHRRLATDCIERKVEGREESLMQTTTNTTQQSGNKRGPDTRRNCTKCVRACLLQAAVIRQLTRSPIGPCDHPKANESSLCCGRHSRRGNCFRDNILTSVELHACGSSQEPAALHSSSYITGCSSIITPSFTNSPSSCPRLLLAIVHSSRTPAEFRNHFDATLKCTFRDGFTSYTVL